MNQDIEKHYAELQMAATQIQEIEKELITIETKKLELLKINESLENLDYIRTGTNTFANIGSGIYAPAKIDKIKSLLVNVGAGILVNKSIPKSKEMIQKQINQADLITLNLTKNIELLTRHAEELQQQIEKLMQKNHNPK